MVNRTLVTALATVTAILVGLASLSLKAQSAPPTAVGSWLGIARPCTPGSRFPVPPNTVSESVCREACLGGACPASNFPVDEVVMAPTLLPEGIVIATDHLSLFDHHPTSQGRWENVGKTVIDGKQYDRYQATFLWFQPRSPQDVDPRNPLSIFLGVTRPRFVMFFDPTDPDIMRGYIQPYVYAMTDAFGIVNLTPNTPFPAADPVGPLPAACDPRAATNPYCAGTLMFVIRRIPGR